MDKITLAVAKGGRLVAMCPISRFMARSNSKCNGGKVAIYGCDREYFQELGYQIEYVEAPREADLTRVTAYGSTGMGYR